MFFFFTARGNFSADSNNFFPCPSHVFHLNEIQTIKRIAIVGEPIVVPAAFIMGSKSPSLRPHSMAPTPAPESMVSYAGLQLRACTAAANLCKYK
jgi:hypothetical protein